MGAHQPLPEVPFILDKYLPCCYPPNDFAYLDRSGLFTFFFAYEYRLGESQPSGPFMESSSFHCLLELIDGRQGFVGYSSSHAEHLCCVLGS